MPLLIVVLLVILAIVLSVAFVVALEAKEAADARRERFMGDQLDALRKHSHSLERQLSELRDAELRQRREEEPGPENLRPVRQLRRAS